MRFGILGWGSIGRRHGHNLMGLGMSVFFWDPARNGSIPREQLIAESDAIIVCSPSQEHSKDFREAVTQGIDGKHVLVEKPFGYDSPDFLAGYLQGVRDKRPNLIVATGYMLRFHPCVQVTKELLDNGELGEIQAASFSVLQKSDKEAYLRDGIIRNWLSHEIDLAHYLLGEGEGQVVSCTADDQREAFLVMKFDKVADKVFLQADYFTTPQQRFFWIEGSKAGLYVNLETGEIAMREGAGKPKLFFQDAYPESIWDLTYIDEMKAFVHSIETGVHQAPLATGEDGITALYTIMAARKAAGLDGYL